MFSYTETKVDLRYGGKMLDEERQRLNEESWGLVVKSNDLIQKTHYQLSVNEQKIVIYLISKIMIDDTNLNEVNMSIKDFCLLTNTTPKGENYDKVRDSVRKLRDRSWWIKLDDNTEMLYSWIDYAVIKKNTGNIKICLSQSLTPFLTSLKSRYTKYHLREILKLKKSYSIRIFEWCQSYLYKGEAIIEIDEFRAMLELGTKYIDYRDLRTKIIEPSIKEINEQTFLHVEYEPIKSGKKVEKIKFKINEAMGYQLSLLDE